jgi:Nickel responsive protein SCO4226-like
MQKYVIERSIPGLGKMSAAELNAASKKSREALARMGPSIQWVQSYVTDDTLYCVYLAHNEDEIRTHAKAAGVPATRISRVKTIIDPLNGN